MPKALPKVPYYYNSLDSLNVSHLVTKPLTQDKGITSCTSEARNDSGYEDILTCSSNQWSNGFSRVQGYHNDSGLCTKGLVTKLSFASLSSSCSDGYYCAGSESSVIPYGSGKSSRQVYHDDSGFCNKNLATKLSFANLSSSCSDAYYCAGSESSVVSHKAVKSSNVFNFGSMHQVVNLPMCTPSGYSTHCQNQSYTHHPVYDYYLTKLYPLQSYAAPLENSLYYNTNYGDLTEMVVSP